MGWRIFLAAMAVAACSATYAAAAPLDAASLSAAPGEAAEAAYRAALARYDQAVAARPGDVALAVERCRYIELVVDLDEAVWSRNEYADGPACRKALLAAHGDDAQAVLYALPGLPDKFVFDQAAALQKRAAAWPPADQGKLLGHLAFRYREQKANDMADQFAIAAAQADKDSAFAGTAARALARTHRSAEAWKILNEASPPTHAYDAEQRIRAAIRLGDYAFARRLLDLDPDWKIDAVVAVDVRMATGDLDGAAKALGAATEVKNPSLSLVRQRFDVAFARGDVGAATAALTARFGRNDDAVPAAYDYLRLAVAAPAAALRSPLGWFGLALVLMALVLLALPGLLLVPVHYRGLARRLSGRRLTPVFGRYGLWNAFFALDVLVFAQILVAPLLMSAAQIAANVRNEASTQPMAAMLFAGTLAAALAFVPLARRLGTRGLFGSQDRALTTALRVLGACLILFAVIVAYSLLWQLLGRAPAATDQTRAVQAVTQTTLAGYGYLGVIGLMVVLVPYVEEFVFRGVLLDSLSQHLSFRASNVLQAALFATIHMDPPRFVVYFVIGLLAGKLARDTRGLLAPFLLHAINNGVVLLLAT